MHKLQFSIRMLATIFTILVISKPTIAVEKPEIFVQVGHTENIASVAFSPNGKYLISGDVDISVPQVKIWDSYTGKLIRSFEGPKSGTKFVTISPNNKYALSFGLFDLKVWDLSNGKEIQTIALSGAEWAAFSPDGKTISVLRSSLDSELGIWEISSGTKIKTIPGRFNTSFSRDPSDKYIIRDQSVYDATTGGLIKKILDFMDDGSPDFSCVYSAFSDNYQYAAFGHIKSNTIALWNFNNGGKRRSVLKTTGTLLKIDISYDGKYLGALLKDNGKYVFRVWVFNGGKRIGNIILRDPISAGETYAPVVTSPDWKYVVAGYKDGSVRKFDISTSEEVMAFTSEHNNQEYMPVYFDRFLATTADDDWNIWDVHKGTIVKKPNEKFSENKFRSYIYNKAFKMDKGKKVIRVTHTAQSADQNFNAKTVGGTVKLFVSKTNKEIAQFISFKDGEWIVITPEGYFNASPNGAKHLNVRIGNKMFSIDNFYNRFYRPAIVQLALAGKELPRGESIGEIFSKKPAPSVRILSPETGVVVDKENIDIAIKVVDNGGGIGDINVYLNGSQVSNDSRGIAIAGKRIINEKALSFAIPLLEGQNEIRVIAFNNDGSMESKPAIITITSKAVPEKPNIYAIVTGINEYRNKNISLRYAVPDAKAFAKTLEEVARPPLFENVHIKLLSTYDNTTKKSIQSAFDEIRKKIRPNDIFVFYVASHGVIDIADKTEQYYLLTSNILFLSSRHIERDAMSQKELIMLIGTIPAQKKLVILDTCHAGKAGKEIAIALLQQTRGLTESTAIKLLQRAIGSAVFSASSDTQQALEGYKGHGLFTYAVIEGLRGDADLNKDGYVKISELQDYVEEKVVTLSEQVFNRQQIPTIQTSANFPVASVK